jgi:hypothetical protein
VDFAGNAAAAVSSTFTTSASALADAAPFRLSSTEPASGSVGVPNDSPLVFHFTKLLGSSSIAQAIILQANPGFPIFGTWSIQGSTATFTPKGPLPSATTFMVAIFNTFRFGGYFTDEAGVALDRSYSFSFTTAVRTDTTPPALISVTPAAGTPLSPISNTFTLLFSKPVVIGAQALQAYNGSQAAPTNGSYGQDAQTVIASVFVAADTVLTLVGTDGIKDDAGNSITPFTFQYPTLKANETGPPTVVSISPNGYAMDVSPTTPIKITFNKAMDPISLVGALHVTQDGQEITGRVEVLDSNHSLQFTPGLPYHAGSRVEAFVLTIAVDLTGNNLPQRYQSQFFVTSTPASAAAMTVLTTSFRKSVGPEASLDVRFDRDLDAATVSEQNIWLRIGQARIAGQATLRDPRTVRFHPSEPLRPTDRYILTTGPGLRSTGGLTAEPHEFGFDVDPMPADARLESAVYDAGPAIRLRFSVPVSPLSWDGIRLLAADGSQVPAVVRMSADGREWMLTPSAGQRFPLPLRVVVDGVEDRSGRKLPRESREAGLVP